MNIPLQLPIKHRVTASSASGGSGDGRGMAAAVVGNPDGRLIRGSQAVGLIDDVPSRGELIQRMVRECRERFDVARADCH